MKKELNTIEELKEEIEVLNKKCLAIEFNLTNLVKKELLKLLGKDVEISIYGTIRMWRGIRCSFEIDFINENGKRDFGSNFSIYYENNELSINNGTIGSYNKHDTYQVLRVKLINAIWENIEEVEKIFTNYSKEFETYNELSSLSFEYNQQINHIKSQQKEEEYKKIEDTLKVGDSYQAISIYGGKGDIYKITKITDKLIYVEYKDRWQSIWKKQFKKKEFIIEIHNNHFKKVENPDINS